MSMLNPNGTVDKGQFTSLREIWPHVEYQRCWNVAPVTQRFWIVQQPMRHGIAGSRE